MKHILKQYDTFADATLSGEKPFELRCNDRNFQKGDLVQFEVVERFEPHAPADHPLNAALFEITYVVSGWGMQQGYVAFGIKKIS